jgi:hypothetical protein
MDNAGLSSRAAADQLGHANTAMTTDVYFGRKVATTGAPAVLEALETKCPRCSGAASDSWGLAPRPSRGSYRPSKPSTCGNPATSSVLPAATSWDVPAPVMTWSPIRSPIEVRPAVPLLMASVRRHDGDQSGSARAEDMPKAMKLPPAVRSAESRT